jgi:RNA polymerase sigma-70 factor (ECF subfamily)
MVSFLYPMPTLGWAARSNTSGCHALMRTPPDSFAFLAAVRSFAHAKSSPLLSKRRTLIAEADLVALLQQRDQRGFALLYDNYSAALYGIILKIVRTEEVAADVMQDAFVKIWRNIDSYHSGKGTLFTWILNVARNTAIDKIRSQDFQQASQNQSLDHFVGIVEQENPVDMHIDAIGLRRVVAGLRPEHRTLIELIYFQGYTQAEVSEELNIPLGTVKTRIKTALMQLRSLITGLLLLLVPLRCTIHDWITRLTEPH